MKAHEIMKRRAAQYSAITKALEEIYYSTKRECDIRYLSLRLLREYSDMSRKECANIAGYGSSASARGVMVKRGIVDFELRLIYNRAVKIAKS